MRYHFLALALPAALGAPTLGQLIPPPEAGDAIVTTQLVDDEVEMRDAASDAPILMPKGIPLWEDRNGAGCLQPTIDFHPQPAGFDVVYTFDNTGQEPRILGALNIGILTLGSHVDYPDMRYICEPKYADYVEGYKVVQMQYPDTTYSPAWVLENKDYAVGVSIQYPILEYKHNVRLCLYSPEGRFADGEGGRGWKLEFLLSNVGNENDANKLLNSGSIDPGQKHTYVVSVRVTKKPDEWVRTLVPYRNWFRGHYGPVAYQRLTKCINSRSVTSGDLCTDDNPLGFGDSRPDIDGWGPSVTNMLLRRDWDILLFMTSSGSYRKNWVNNMPFQFATNWNYTQELATAYDPAIGFPRLPAAGQKLGLWWGRSLQIADQWDDPTLEPFDLRNPDHRKRAFAEMDLAASTGTTVVGLDTFSPKYMPLWDQIDWLHELKNRYPGIRYCAEPVSCDLINREIGTFYRGHKDRNEVDSPDQIDGFYNPHFMADFLIPGAEIWGAFRWSTYADFGIYFTDEQKTEKMREIASLGYTPCSRENFELKDPSIETVNSWEYTVPADVRIQPDDDSTDPFPTFGSFNVAYKAGSPDADLNFDGSLDMLDYTAWQNRHVSYK